MCIVIICLLGDGVINFKINHNFFYQAVFLLDQKRQDKNLNILREKRAFRAK